MSDYPSWSEDRDAYAEAKWSAAPPAASHYGGGGGGGYPGADAYSAAPDAYSRGAAGGYAQYENRGSAGYGSAGHGSAGYGSAGGGGGGGYGGNSAASSYVPKPGGHVGKASEISFDTSSRDPAHLRSRVFIGCLGQTLVVREDIIELCRPFGPLMAATLFKQGYAFVQFEQAEDADNACEVLNGKRWKGVNIDVHLAMEGLVRKTLPQKRGAEKQGGGGARGGGGAGGGRGSMGGGGGGGGMGAGGMEGGGDWQGISSAKKAKLATAPLGSSMNEEAMMEVNRANRDAAVADNSTPELIGGEMADTLICGTCRYVTSDFVAFREHRKGACVKPKESTEPPVLRCASCGLRFLSAWKMLFHLTDFHRMQLFKADYTEESIERARYEDKKYQGVSETRMNAWRTELANERAFVVEPAAAAPAAAAPHAGGGDASSNNNGSAAAGRTGGGGGAAPASQPKQSFAEDDADVNTFGAAATAAGKVAAPAAAAKPSSAPMERVTTGADYDEDEEDEDDGAPAPIPSLV